MTSARSAAAYISRTLGSGVFGRTITNGAKYTAGCYFDLCCRQYRTEGMTFESPRQHTTRTMRGRFASDTYELPERQLIRTHLPSDARVLELGGCIGVVSCLTNSLLRNSAAHVVVEANPNLIPFLKHNRDVNGAHFVIEQGVICRALSATLMISANMDGSRMGAGGLEVRTLTLESLEVDHHIAFNALIMDIEGAESEFLRENRAALLRVQFVAVEFHPGILGEAEVSELRTILVESGLVKIDQMLTTEVYGRR